MNNITPAQWMKDWDRFCKSGFSWEKENRMLIEVLKKNAKWYWRINRKGRVLSHSEQYHTKSNALRGAKLMAKLANECQRAEIQVIPEPKPIRKIQ